MSDLINFVIAGVVAGMVNAVFNQIGLHFYKQYLEHHVIRTDEKVRAHVLNARQALKEGRL